MRRIHLIMVAALFTSLSTVATAMPIVINFDEDGLGNTIATNTPITSQYANLGVHFEGIEGSGTVDINAAPDPDGATAPSAPNVLTNCANATAACPGNRADILRITFDYAVSGVSLMLDSLGGSAVTFNLFDASDLLLESVSITSGGSFFVPVAFTAGNVSRIDGLQPDDGWAWAMDDLTFSSASPSPVPAPAPLVLLGLGLLGLGFTRRRAKS